MSSASTIHSKPGIGERRRQFAASIARRNKRRAPNRNHPIWPVAFSDILIGTLILVAMAYFFVDESAVRFVRILPGNITGFFGLITDIGKSEWILIPTGAFCLVLVFYNWQSLPVRRQVWLSGILFDAWFMFVAVAGSGLVVSAIKPIVGRARPKHLDALGFGYFDPLRFEASFASFPSGHATTIAAVATVLALRFPKYTTGFIAMALLIGSSRVFVGAHYPSDVIMGMATGMLFTLALARGFAVRQSGFRFVEDGARDKVLPIRRIIRGLRR